MNNRSGESGVVRDLALLQHEYAYACHGLWMKLVLGMNLQRLQRVAVRLSKKVEKHQSQLLRLSVLDMDRR